MIRGSVDEEFVGAAVLDRAAVPLGEVHEVFLDEARHPAWVGVRVPVLGSEVLVPLEDATWEERALRVAVSSTTALDAPKVAGEQPTQHDEERLSFHYGLPCLRSPRGDLPSTDIDGEVCYSVHDDNDEQEPQQNGEAMKEAEQAVPPTVSGHMLPPAEEVSSPR